MQGSIPFSVWRFFPRVLLQVFGILLEIGFRKEGVLWTDIAFWYFEIFLSFKYLEITRQMQKKDIKKKI